MSDSHYLGISKDRIARIWEGPDGFTVTDFWGRNLGVYGNDADAGERARDLGYEEIIWEDVQPTTPEATTPTTAAERKYWERHEEVTRLLERARELVDAHAEAATAGGAVPNFSHAGDLLHVQQLLDQLVAFLSPDGE